jgi:hypothetical protein
MACNVQHLKICLVQQQNSTKTIRHLAIVLVHDRTMKHVGRSIQTFAFRPRARYAYLSWLSFNRMRYSL